MIILTQIRKALNFEFDKELNTQEKLVQGQKPVEVRNSKFGDYSKKTIE